MAEQTKQKKFYYMQYCPYGVRIRPDSLNGNAFSYYAFTSYAERQKWLDARDMDGCNWVAAPITRAELVNRIGKRFYIVKYFEWRQLYDDEGGFIPQVLSYKDVYEQYSDILYKSF